MAERANRTIKERLYKVGIKIGQSEGEIANFKTLPSFTKATKTSSLKNKTPLSDKQQSGSGVKKNQCQLLKNT
jgi:hypothetical protein